MCMQLLQQLLTKLFWNFAGILYIGWRCACCLDIFPRLFFSLHCYLGTFWPGHFRGGSRKISEGFDLIILPYLFGQTGLSKQCRPRSDATECGIWSGSTLFDTHQVILHTFTCSKMDLLKRSISKSVPNLPNLSKISNENEIFSQMVFFYILEV